MTSWRRHARRTARFILKFFSNLGIFSSYLSLIVLFMFSSVWAGAASLDNLDCYSRVYEGSDTHRYPLKLQDNSLYVRLGNYHFKVKIKLNKFHSVIWKTENLNGNFTKIIPLGYSDHDSASSILTVFDHGMEKPGGQRLILSCFAR